MNAAPIWPCLAAPPREQMDKAAALHKRDLDTLSARHQLLLQQLQQANPSSPLLAQVGHGRLLVNLNS